MKRIGITCNSFPHGGGMERVALDIVVGLLDRGITPVVFTKKLDRYSPLLKRLPDIIVVNKKWLPNKLRDPYFVWRVNHWRKKMGVETMIACNPFYPAEIAVCGGEHRGYLSALSKHANFFDRLAIAREEKQFGAARYILACSEQIKQNLIKFYGVASEKIRIFYPAADTDKFMPTDDATRSASREKFGFAADKKIFLFPSGDHKRKGLSFLRAFFENTDLPVELVVVGRPTNESRNVRYLGYTTEINLLYQAADAAIMASSVEPFGLVPVEAALCNTPTIMSDRAGCGEVMSEPALITIDPTNTAELAVAVKKIIAFDRAAAGDLRRFIRYDCRKEKFVDDLIALLS